MEEAVAEAEQSADDSHADKASIEGIVESGNAELEDSAGHQLVDTTQYKSEFSNKNNYKKISHQAKSQPKETARNSSAEKSDIGQAVSDLEKEAKSFGIDKTEYVSSKFAKKLYNKSVANKSTELVDGAIALIYHVDEETGKVEHYLERKRLDYSIVKERGKISLLGGLIEHGEGPLETLIREIGEEVNDPSAKKILTNSLMQDGGFYDLFVEYQNGKVVKHYVYVIPVKSKKDWAIVTNSGFTHDAGSKSVIDNKELLELLQKNPEYFAFIHGDIIKSHIHENFMSAFYNNLNLETLFQNRFKHFTYSDSIIPHNFNTKNNYQFN